MGLEMSLRVLGQQCSGGIEVSMLTNTGKHIDHFAAIWFGILNAVSRDQWETEMRRKID